MPFVTSEIYEKLVLIDDKELMLSKWPEENEKLDFANEENIVEKLKQIIVEIRNVRANMNIHPSKKSELIFVTEKYAKEIKEAQEFILKLGFGSKITIQSNKDNIAQNAISIMQDGINLYMPLNDLVDMDEEKKRLQNEITKLEAEVERCKKMLSNPGFVNKAPETKINEEKAKLAKYEEMLKQTKEHLQSLE